MKIKSEDSVKMDKQLESLLYDDLSYDTFRSEICHMYKSDGAYGFINKVMRTDLVGTYWERKEYVKALYTLAMIDYISYKNNVPFYEGYEGIRKCKLEEIIYPPSILMLDKMENSHANRDKAVEECSNDECGVFFFRHNIIEKNITDVA